MFKAFVYDSKASTADNVHKALDIAGFIPGINGIIVGNNVQVENNFYIIECTANNVKRMIGILNEGHGIIPTVAKLKKSDILVVASDESLYILDLKANAEFKNIISDSLIFDLIVREDEEKVVAIVS